MKENVFMMKDETVFCKF